MRTEAHDIRQERTGIHARLRMILGDDLLASTTDNIERDEVRTRIGNSAYKQFEEAEALAMSAEDLKRYLTVFCDELWSAHLQTTMPEEIEGELLPSRVAFVLEPWIVEAGGTILFAPPGRGKSYLGKLMAICVDAGMNDFGQTFPRKVLFCNLERSKQSIQRRLGNINEALGLDRQRSLLTLNAKGRSLMEVYSSLEKSIRDNDVGLLVLDSISRAGFGDLTENMPMNRIVDALNRLCPSWLAIAHSPRADEGHAFGSVMQDAGADVMVQLTSQQAENGSLGVQLEIVKANDLGWVRPKTFVLDFNDFGLAGIRTAKEWEFPELVSGKKASIKEQVQDYLLDTGKASATTIAKETGLSRAKVSLLLNRDPDFVEAERKGKSVLYGVKERVT